MKFLKSFSILTLLLTLVLFTSCKKCKVENTSTNSGVIIEDVVLYPSSGYMTPNMNGDYVIDANNPYADRFEMSLNAGERTAINYANFTVLAFPVTARCNAAFERIVDINNTTQTVTYTLNVTQCSNCKEERFTENYVLVPAFPANYTMVYDLNVVDKE
jgi:benzoyl-CoA reductase/2-hydroxyglutaryl-CoA dehydratase subunit BcrC/BadD/HgdB